MTPSYADAAARLVADRPKQGLPRVTDPLVLARLVRLIASERLAELQAGARLPKAA